MMYMVWRAVLMTWLFLMNSSEGSQVTIRDLRMPPSLGDTTGRVTSLAPPEEPEGRTQGSTPRRSTGEHPTAEWDTRVGEHSKTTGTERTQGPPQPWLHVRAIWGVEEKHSHGDQLSSDLQVLAFFISLGDSNVQPRLRAID